MGHHLWWSTSPIYNPDNSAHFARSIVAIHGLDGHREESWTTGTADNAVLWLRDLLPTEIPTARILTFGYDANTRGKDQLTTQTLYDHAEALIGRLVLFRQKTAVLTVFFPVALQIVY